MNDNRFVDRLIFIVVFFVYSGYYAGLALIFSAGFFESSRFYSIPLRLFLVVLMSYIIGKYYKNSKWGPNYSVLTLFIILYFFKVLYTENLPPNKITMGRGWYEYCFYFFSFCVLPFFTFSTIDFRKYKNTILNAFIFSGFALGVLSLFLYKDMLIQGVGRISMAKYENPETEETLSPLALSYSGAITITLCVYRLIYDKTISSFNKLYLYLTTALSFIMFFLGATRGSLVALILSIPVLMYFGSLKNKVRITLLTIIVVPLVIYGAEATGSAIFTRTADSLETGDASGREGLWSDAFNEFLENPLLGGRIEVSGIYPHNIFLETLMATGIVGFLLFVYVFLSSFINGIKLSNQNTDYLIPFLIFINAFSQHMFTGGLWSAILLFVPMGTLLSTNINLKEQIKPIK